MEGVSGSPAVFDTYGEAVAWAKWLWCWRTISSGCSIVSCGGDDHLVLMLNYPDPGGIVA
jgi:hypothetical protein